jgi:hypothetical protein
MSIRQTSQIFLRTGIANMPHADNGLWDGARADAASPKGKGSSSGKKGIELRMDLPEPCGCIKPITKRAKIK